MGSSSSSQVVPEGHQRANLTEPARQSNHISAAAQAGIYPQLVLFGDSITQNATLTLQPRLQALYVRRADVINRGFSGYTSILALQSLPAFLPFAPSVPLTSQTPVRIVTVFFGANDAALPHYAQHVPLSNYVASLERIAQYDLFQQHNTKIILITPAPVDEWQLEKPVSRTAINTRRYARAARELAKKLNLPCVDLWTTFATLCGYQDAPHQVSLDRIHDGNTNREESETAETLPSNPSLAATADEQTNAIETSLPGSLSAPRNKMLASLLTDGLHFTPLGYDVLYDELLATIRKQVPECLPENMPSIFEPWRDILGVPKKEPAANTDGATDPSSAVDVDTGAHPHPHDTKTNPDARGPTLSDNPPGVIANGATIV